MTPEEKLKQLESILIEQGLIRLENMICAYGDKKFFKKCAHSHMEECVKLAHRVRSLLSKEVA